jgi:hypothetical protein
MNESAYAESCERRRKLLTTFEDSMHYLWLTTQLGGRPEVSKACAQALLDQRRVQSELLELFHVSDWDPDMYVRMSKWSRDDVEAIQRSLERAPPKKRRKYQKEVREEEDRN